MAINNDIQKNIEYGIEGKNKFTLHSTSSEIPFKINNNFTFFKETELV